MSAVLGLAHVGIAVRSLEESIPRWTRAFGFRHMGTVEFPPMGLRIAFLRTGESELELLEPTSPESPVGRFLGQRGPGIHHVSFHVRDIDEALAGAREAGLTLIDQSARVGAHGTRIAFVHPRSIDGVLVEFCEKAPS